MDRRNQLRCWSLLILFAAAGVGRGAETLHLQVVENSPTGFVVGTVQVSSASNFRVEESCANYFAIRPDTGEITVLSQANLDREAIPEADDSDVLRCFVGYDLSNGAQRHIVVDIEILDLNDCDPHFFGLSNPRVLRVLENVALPTPLLLLQPTDQDRGLNGTTEFNITSGNEDGFFSIALAEGDTAESTTNRVLFLVRMLNYEMLPNGGVFNLTITIRDMAVVPRTQVQRINIEVTDLEDEPPTFETTSYVFNITESHPVGSNEVFAQVRAASDESGGDVFYSFCTNQTCSTGVSVSEVIGLKQSTGELYLKKSIDFESLQHYRFEIEASNLLTRQKQATVVTVEVIDVNEHPPYFVCKGKKYIPASYSCGKNGENVNNSEIFIEENSNATLPSRVFVLNVADCDQTTEFKAINGTSASYQILPEDHPFIVDIIVDSMRELTAMRINGTLDRELTPDFTVVLTVENRVQPTLQTETTLVVRVMDVNDNTPEFSRDEYRGSVFEGSPEEMEILRVHAYDPDEGENGTVTYLISSISEDVAQGWFQISETDGTVSVQDASSLDYLSLGGSAYVTLNITASDNGSPQMSSSATVVISVLPSATFISGSYQEYSGAEFNLLDDSSTSFYMEFRTSARNGLLAYQVGAGGEGAVFAVELRNGATVVARRGQSQMTHNGSNITDDVWHSVHVQWTNSQITSLIVGPVESVASRLALLQDLSLQRCIEIDLQSLDHSASLYIGGVNLFQLPPNTLPPQASFMGVIRNIVVGGTRLDSTCPAAEINTAIGVVRDHGCAELQCNSSRSSQCVDYADQSYCQCRGGFSTQACRATESTQENQSYAPIRFHGSTMVNLNLGYSFFYDLEVQGNGGVFPGGDQVGAPAPVQRRRRRREGGIVQEVEMRFRLVTLRSAVLLYSNTSSSIHLIRLVLDDSSSLIYSIWNSSQTILQTPAINISINFPFEEKVEYHLRAATERETVSLTLSGENRRESWGGNPVTPFAKQPQTDIGIGGASDAFVNTSDPVYSYFMGCITKVSINGIELPLNGLLNADSDDGGFQVEDKSGVENFCNLCDLEICPESSVCESDNLGDTRCICQGGLVMAPNHRSCLVPTTPTVAGLLTAAPQSTLVSYVGGGVGAGLLVLLGVVIIVIIAAVRRRQERQKSTYNINSASMGTPRASKPANVYTPTIPKRRPSLTSSTNANCADSHERGSSVSTFQEHDRDPESETPTHRGSKRLRHMSVESGIKMDTDQETSIGRGIPQMDDSGHEVNSTDSARSEESEDIPSSCCNEQIPPRPTICLRMVGAIPSPDQFSRSPCTPLTPKEKKIMIPLRPASTNLSQSEFGDEVTDIETESFITRVSSSSGVGGSMQNQGRGSDSEKSGCSTLQWYKSSTNSDTERENERIQANRSYYPMHPALPPEEVRGNARNYLQPRFKPTPVHPPIYYSPPSFSDHMTSSSYSRPRSKSMHATTKSPLATVPQRYENYPPHIFASEGVRKGRLVYEEHKLDPSYEGNPRRDRQLSDPRALNEQGYTPTSFSRQYSDPRIPHNGNYCIPRKQNELQPLHSRQMSDPRQSSQQTQDSILAQPRSSHSMRHIPSPSTYTGKRPSHHGAAKAQQPYYTLGQMIPDHVHYTANQPGRSFSSGDAAPGEEPFQTLSSLSKIDPISKWDAQARMKIAVDHMDPCHLLSGPYMQFEDVSTDPSVVESQLTMDESMMGDQVFESQGGGEGTADMLDPLDMRLARLREDEIDSILTDSEIGWHEMNHFPSADCSSQYTATIVAGSTSTSGESTPKLQRVFVIPPSQQSFDV